MASINFNISVSGFEATEGELPSHSGIPPNGSGSATPTRAASGQETAETAETASIAHSSVQNTTAGQSAAHRLRAMMHTPAAEPVTGMSANAHSRRASVEDVRLPDRSYASGVEGVSIMMPSVEMDQDTRAAQDSKAFDDFEKMILEKMSDPEIAPSADCIKLAEALDAFSKKLAGLGTGDHRQTMKEEFMTLNDLLDDIAYADDDGADAADAGNVNNANTIQLKNYPDIARHLAHLCLNGRFMESSQLAPWEEADAEATGVAVQGAEATALNDFENAMAAGIALDLIRPSLIVDERPVNMMQLNQIARSGYLTLYNGTTLSVSAGGQSDSQMYLAMIDELIRQAQGHMAVHV